MLIVAKYMRVPHQGRYTGLTVTSGKACTPFYVCLVGSSLA